MGFSDGKLVVVGTFRSKSILISTILERSQYEKELFISKIVGRACIEGLYRRSSAGLGLLISSHDTPSGAMYFLTLMRRKCTSQLLKTVAETTGVRPKRTNNVRVCPPRPWLESLQSERTCSLAESD